MFTSKESARSAIERLPDHASWDDIMYELYVKQKIKAGMQAVEEGRTISHEEMKQHLRQRPG